MKSFLVGTATCLGLIVLLLVYGCTTVPEGEKVGTVVKVATEGWLCPTREAMIIRGAITDGSGAFGQTFQFTTTNDEDWKILQDAMRTGAEIRVVYYHTVPVFCAGETGSFAKRVEKLAQSK